MKWLALLQLLLRLAAYFARRAERRDIEEALTNAIKASMDKRVDAAADARSQPHDDSLPDPHDRANRRTSDS